MIIALLSTLFSEPSLGEAVRVKAGPNTFGQGWLFVDPSGRCRVATAAHVIDRNGKLSDALIIDQRGREMPAHDAVLPDDNLDLAVMAVTAGRRGPLCTASRLGLDNLAPGLSGMTDAFMLTMESGELRTIRMEPRARSVDEEGGTVFAVAPLNSSDSLYQGMSGSIILREDETPMGMLFEVIPEENIGVALRFDVIKHAILSNESALSEPTAVSGLLKNVTVVQGETIDPALGPLALTGHGESWQVRTQGRIARALIHLSETRRLNGISLTHSAVTTGPLPVALGVATSANQNAATSSANYCRASTTNKDTIVCRFAPRQVQVLDLKFVAKKKNEILSVGSIDVLLAPAGLH